MATANFLHFPPTFKSAISSDLNLNFVVFNVENSFRDGVRRGRCEKFTIQHELVTELEKVKANITAKIKQFPYFRRNKLYEDSTVLKTVRR